MYYVKRLTTNLLLRTSKNTKLFLVKALYFYAATLRDET